MLPTPEQERAPKQSASPTSARTMLGTTLAVFFTITGIGAAFQATCIATTAGTSNFVAGMAVGIVAALIATGVLLNLFWGKPPSPPPK